MTIIEAGVRAVLTIAGSDSSGGAGIQADLKTFAAIGVYGTSAITAVTAQNTTGVLGTSAMPAEFVTLQIEAVASDIALHAVKTGMLANAAIVEAVAAAVREMDLPLLVVDPVMVAKSGSPLLDEDGIGALERELLPSALLVTPNIPEAEILSGRRIVSLDDRREAARAIRDLGASAVLVKGGHAFGADRGGNAIDLLFDGERFTEFSSARVDTPNTHGTGCTLAAAIAAYLALDPGPAPDLVAAVRNAHAYVNGAIRHALQIGRGHGPLDHFWNMSRR